MAVSTARAILLRHDDTLSLDPHALIQPGHVRLATTLRLEAMHARAPLPGPADVAWSSVPIEPIVSAAEDVDAPDAVASAWDAAHALVIHARAEGGSDETYAEPDLLYTLQPDVQAAAARSAALESLRAGEWIPQWPPSVTDTPKPPIDWFLDHSRLREARTRVAERIDSTFRITVAHLDTGYNPKHVGLPRGLLWGRGIDFTVDPPGKDVSDPGVPEPVLSSPGHGTGTACLLAGGHCSITGEDLGGVPFADILPVRISEHVWHLWTSVIPKGIRYAIEQGAQVINLCHGGLPTRSWADAVNAAYEAGVVICAATGDNFGGLPYRWVVWPARYPQVIGVAGVTYAQTPYFDASYGVGTLEGNFGPTGDMGNVIAAYTPNVPWARCRLTVDGQLGGYVTDGYDLDGGGTSGSTPQVAAAAALYMQYWWPTLQSMPGWQRVEVVRAALKASANTSAHDIEHFGAGWLDAMAMLDQHPETLAPTVKKLVPSEFQYAFLTHQPGWPATVEGERRMLQIELTHIALSNPALWEAVNAWQTSGAVTADPQFQTLREAFLACRNPRPSKTLRDLLTS